MMTSAAQTKASYERRFSELRMGKESDGKAWLRTLRERAMGAFNVLGFPTTRDEEWKYTDVAPIARTAFRPAVREESKVASDSLAGLLSADFEAYRLVFVNGYYVAALSSPLPTSQEIELGSLAAALEGDNGWLESHLGRYADYERHAFVALNTALMEDGAFVSVPDGKVLSRPIHLVFISRTGVDPTMCHPRVLIRIGECSQAAVVESYVGLGQGCALVNSVSEIVLGRSSVAEHYKIQREGGSVYHLATLQVDLSDHANFTSHLVVLGGALSRNELNVALNGEGCECALNGLYIAGGAQHMDNRTRIDHFKPHGTSRELYKGILHGNARGVFNGKIFVHKSAPKTDARQVNKNLLLSRGAWVDTKPQLEIYNNDVKCSHGSTIGQLDQDAIFYLRSRGLDVETARGLLTYAFASEVINRIKVEPLRRELDEILAGKYRAASQTGGGR